MLTNLPKVGQMVKGKLSQLVPEPVLLAMPLTT